MNEARALKEQKAQQKRKIGKKGPWIVLGVFALLAGVTFCYWLFYARFYISTNDAYVEGNRVEIFPQISGTVTAIHIQEMDYVKEGDILIELDPTEAKLAFDHSLSSLANTVREVVQKFDQVYQCQALVKVKESELHKAQNHYNNRAPLVDMGAVTKEDFQNAQVNLTTAQAALNQSLESLRGAEAQIYNTTVQTHPLVLKAQDQVRSSWIQLQRTVIRSPIEGYVALKNTQVGEFASPSQPLLSIIPLNEIWVNANFREVKLDKVKLGQHVELTSDVYKNQVKFSGKVVGISPGTGSALSVLPPQNAAGNWIKIVQRIPVRIELNLKEIQKYPLQVGLSMEARINLKQEVPKSFPAQASMKPLYQTKIYQNQLDGVQAIIERVVQDNINWSIVP